MMDTPTASRRFPSLDLLSFFISREALPCQNRKGEILMHPVTFADSRFPSVVETR